MPATAPTPTSNAQRRALILSQVEGKLKELWPDELPEGRRPFSDFDALEAAATRTGDSLAQTLMEEGLREALQASGADGREHCATCGRKLQWSQKAHSVQTIRGPIRAEREHGYCRACERGFFPLGRALSAGRAPAERTTAAGAQRSGERL